MLAQLIAAGPVALGRSDAIGAASEVLDALVDETGHTGQPAVWGDRGPTIVRWIAGRGGVRKSMTVGTTLPLLASATGRVFLGFRPRRQTAALAAREAMAGGGDPEVLAAQATAQGMGHVAGDHIPGLSALAAFSEAAAVMTLVGHRDEIAPGAAESLRSACARPRTGSGGSPPRHSPLSDPASR